MKRISLFARDLREKLDGLEISSSQVAPVAHVLLVSHTIHGRRTPIACPLRILMIAIFTARIQHVLVLAIWLMSALSPLRPKGNSQTVLHCAPHSHPPNPERAETRSCPWRAPFHRETSLLHCPYKGWPDWSLTARVRKVSLCLLKGGLVDPQVRASNDINAPSKLARYLLGMGAD